MRRDLSTFLDSTYDLLVIGAGIHGACIAWDAALRGLSVAVVDQGDFGAATSANSLRIVHGGLRYLARGDLARVRESILREITDREGRRLHDAPIVGFVEPSQHLQQRRLSGAVRSAESDALAVGDLPRDVLEQYAFAERFG